MSSIIPDISFIREEISKTGFVCLKCGACCTEIEKDSNIVMVTRNEVKRISKISNKVFDEIAEPYPGRITSGDKTFTFGWALRRKEGRCIFLNNNRCEVYLARPWICRTYPFMIVDGRVCVSECGGLGLQNPEIDPLETLDMINTLTNDLIERFKAELEEEKRIEEIMKTQQIPDRTPVVIDGEGMVEI